MQQREWVIFDWTNTGLAFPFSEIYKEINGTEIHELKSLEYHRLQKGYYSHTPNDSNELENAAWDLNMNDVENKEFVMNGTFSGCISLEHLFGFCEDYKKKIYSI